MTPQTATTPQRLPRLPGESIDEWVCRFYQADPSFVPPPATTEDGNSFTVKGKTAGGLLLVVDQAGKEYSMTPDRYTEFSGKEVKP